MSKVEEISHDGTLAEGIAKMQERLQADQLADELQKNRSYAVGVTDQGSIILMLAHDYLYLNRDRVGEFITQILEGLRHAKIPGLVIEIRKETVETNEPAPDLFVGDSSSPVLVQETAEAGTTADPVSETQ